MGKTQYFISYQLFIPTTGVTVTLPVVIITTLQEQYTKKILQRGADYSRERGQVDLMCHENE